MGYTHYWRAVDGGRFTDEQWAAITQDFKTLVEKSGIDLLKEYDSNEAPEFTDDYIRFNGKLDLGHETFWFARELDDFQFCKTACKPYDKVVTACLAVAAHHAPNMIKVSSDGDEGDWADGLAYASEALGRQVTYPVTEDA